MFSAVLLSATLLSSTARAAPPVPRDAVATPRLNPPLRLTSLKSAKLTSKASKRASRQRKAAQAKSAGPPERLATHAAQLLRVRVVDQRGVGQREFKLEILVNQEGVATLETEIGGQRYELSVSPNQRTRDLRLSLRRRGDDGFSISTRVDPNRPGLVASSRSGSSRTEIYIARR